MRHLGFLNNTSTRVAVVFLQLEGDPEHALVVGLDHLPPQYESFLFDLIKNDGAATDELYKVLSARLMPDVPTVANLSVLASLHNDGLLRRVSIDQVTMTPRQDVAHPLRLVLESLGRLTTVSNSYDDGTHHIDKFEERADQEEASSKRDIALGIIEQALMLEEEAKNKRQKAYDLCPELKPKQATSKVRSIEPTTIEATATNEILSKSAAPKKRQSKKA